MCDPCWFSSEPWKHGIKTVGNQPTKHFIGFTFEIFIDVQFYFHTTVIKNVHHQTTQRHGLRSVWLIAIKAGAMVACSASSIIHSFYSVYVGGTAPSIL